MLTLPTLTPEEITQLLMPRKRNTRRAKEYGIIVNNNDVIYIANPKAAAKGGFAGKSGTIHRTRKGATRRNPDGKRYYLQSYDSTLTAYIPTRVVK